MYHTHREDYVLKMYRYLRIYTPREIDEQIISRKLRIFLKYHDEGSTYKEHGRFRAILLQRGLSPEEHRIQFFHELGHLLRHDSNRMFISDKLADFLEWDTRLFEMYAALPHHMLRGYDWDAPDIIEQLSDDFVVPSDFAKQRLNQLYRQSVVQPAMIRKKNSQLPAHSESYNPGKWSYETQRIMNQLQEQVGEEVVNYVGLLRRD
ncbi:ImmA/IrrE family metallo-endopeptidase [Salibacterium sp. K-3]